MALGQRIRMTLVDGREFEATYDGRDIRLWERSEKKPALGVPMTLDMLTWFGWSAAHREGILNGEFDRYEQFDAVCVAVEGVKPDEAEPDPTQPAADTPNTASGD